MPRGGPAGRSHLLTKVMRGVPRLRHTSNSRSVRSSTTLAASRTITAASTAVRTREVSSEKSRWPGVSRRLSTQLRWLKRRTVELIEIPRCCSISIQSERVVRSPRRALTRPAVSIAPPYSRSFSVSVVFPASGWETMAKVRRRAASARSSSASWVCSKFLLSARGRLVLGDVGFTPGNDRFAAETIHHCRPLHECEERYQAKEQQHLPRCGHGGSSERPRARR